MPCNTIELPGGGVGVVCSARPRRRPCSKCGQLGDRLCDFPIQPALPGLTSPPSRTCDKPLCRRCAVHAGPDLDYCPSHQPVT